jgi:transcriptional regulator with XRE-family HTH domain
MAWEGGVSVNQCGDRIALLREKFGLTQEELALKIGISRAALSHYEKNRREPDIDILSRMAKFFGVSTDYLIGANKHPAQKLLEYLEAELTDEEIMQRMTFKVDDITLSEDEVKEFIAYVRGKRLIKLQQQASASIKQEP